MTRERDQSHGLRRPMAVRIHRSSVLPGLEDFLEDALPCACTD